MLQLKEEYRARVLATNAESSFTKADQGRTRA